MSEERIESVLSWMRSTDLVEVQYSNGGESIRLRIRDAEAPVEIPPAALLPVTAPAVGVFRFVPPGQARAADKGSGVRNGAALGLIETGGKRVDVCAPAAGKIVRVMVEEGQGVEYGRPLFLIEPA